MQRRDIISIKKIINEIQLGKDLIGDTTQEEFLANELMKRAVAMTVINIGELVKNISDELRSENKYIPWKAIAGMRDITAHRYLTLRMEDVYLAATEELPELVPLMEEIIKDR